MWVHWLVLWDCPPQTLLIWTKLSVLILIKIDRKFENKYQQYIQNIIIMWCCEMLQHVATRCDRLQRVAKLPSRCLLLVTTYVFFSIFFFFCKDINKNKSKNNHGLCFGGSQNTCIKIVFDQICTCSFEFVLKFHQMHHFNWFLYRSFQSWYSQV